MKLDRGSVALDGLFAYVSQQAWIMNCSLKDNILFGEPFDAKKYQTLAAIIYFEWIQSNIGFFFFFTFFNFFYNFFFQLFFNFFFSFNFF